MLGLAASFQGIVHVTRIRGRDVAVIVQHAHSGLSPSLMKIQGDFIREQGSHSMGQAREIGELIVQFGRDAVGALRGET